MISSIQKRPDVHHPGRLLSLLVAALILFIGCGGGDTADTGTDEDARYTFGDPITDSTYALIIESPFGGDTLTTATFHQQMQRFLQQVPAAGMDPAQTRQLRRGIAEEFIRRHLIGGEADRLAITVDSGAVEEQIGLIKGQFPDEATFQQLMTAQGLTMDSLRASIADELRLESMQERMIDAAEEPSAEELEAFRQEQAEQVRAQHILFRVPEPAHEDSVLDVANAVLDSIQAGADFAEMAGRYGSDGTRTRGGDLGFFSRGEMVEPFAEAAFALADSGDVTQDLVKTDFGYHIIRLTGRRTAEAMDSTRARTMMMQKRQREAFENAYARLRDQATIRVNPDILEVNLNAES